MKPIIKNGPYLRRQTAVVARATHGHLFRRTPERRCQPMQAAEDQGRRTRVARLLRKIISLVPEATFCPARIANEAPRPLHGLPSTTATYRSARANECDSSLPPHRQQRIFARALSFARGDATPLPGFERILRPGEVVRSRSRSWPLTDSVRLASIFLFKHPRHRPG